MYKCIWVTTNIENYVIMHIPVVLKNYTHLGERQYNQKGIEGSCVGEDEWRTKIIHIYKYI